jgi:glutamate dehydrogenase/leucine dehydrogenase
MLKELNDIVAEGKINNLGNAHVAGVIMLGDFNVDAFAPAAFKNVIDNAASVVLVAFAEGAFVRPVP